MPPIMTRPASPRDFNLNLLKRINRELEGTFDLGSFEHHAFYNRERHRIEMHLASNKRQKVRVAGECIDFRAGETIHTENSYKYSADSFGALARGTGWTPVAAWTRPQPLFLRPRARLAVTGNRGGAQPSAYKPLDVYPGPWMP